MFAPTFALLLQLTSFAASPRGDYVLHLEVVEGHGSSSSNRTVVYRSGSLVRIDSTSSGNAAGSRYLDVNRGVAAWITRDRNGIVEGAGIERSSDRPTHRTATGRQDRAVGETCAIWRVMEENQDTGSEICETSDGIQLWLAFWYPRPTDQTVMYQRAASLERRAVHREDLLPPRDLLALAFTPPAAMPPPATEPDHEVEMVGGSPRDGSYVLRRHGRFFSHVRLLPRERTYYVGNGAITVDFKEDGAGRPVSLAIGRVGSRPFDGVVSRWQRVRGRAPVRLLGETCTWQEDAAIQSTDRHYYCRTADGIVLKTETWFHWTGETQRFSARRLSRRPLRDEDFALPARALDWATWGIAPAP